MNIRMRWWCALTVVLLGSGLLLMNTGCAGRSRAATASSSGGRAFERGIASWYGRKYHGRSTASGERFNMHAMTAAHPRLPFGTVVRVVRVSNGRKVRVRINDRGPFKKGRVIDLSYGAAKKLDLIQDGVAEVEVFILKRP